MRVSYVGGNCGRYDIKCPVVSKDSLHSYLVDDSWQASRLCPVSYELFFVGTFRFSFVPAKKVRFLSRSAVFGLAGLTPRSPVFHTHALLLCESVTRRS